jgi:hypothetical protein
MPDIEAVVFLLEASILVDLRLVILSSAWSRHSELAPSLLAYSLG